MLRSGHLFDALTSYYSNLAFDYLAAMRETSEDLRTGRFDCSKAMGRACAFWMDAAEGWWSALLMNASAPLPTLFLRLSEDEQSVTKRVSVLVPGKAEPQISDLTPIGGGAPIRAEDHIRVEANKNRDGVDLTLDNVVDLRQRGAGLREGLYQGLIYIDERPLAVVLLQVEPAKRRADKE